MGRFPHIPPEALDEFHQARPSAIDQRVGGLLRLPQPVLMMTLTWDTSYAIARELMRLHAGTNIGDVSLQQIHDWTLQLDDFEDDPALCNDEILSSIYQEWYEELTNDR